MREAERAALSAPTIFEGIAQSAERMRHMHSGRRRESFCPHHLSLWCSPVNTSASHAEEHRSEAGQGRQFMPPKHLERCTPLVWELARCTAIREANVPL